MIKNIILISDIHAGCQFGLSPPMVKLDGGGIYRYSPLQKKMWQWWNIFWNKWVPMVTKNEPFALINIGDSIDGRHHSTTTQISQNIKDQVNIAYEILSPVVSKAQKYFHIRGTEAHSGMGGEHSEILAQRLGAVPNDNGNYARWELWLNMGAARIHACHHIGGTSSSSYESTQVYKETVESLVESGRWGDEPPNVIVRGHRHRQFETRISGKHGYVISLVVPGWQLKTPFTYRLASARAGTPQCGGYLVRIGDEDSIYTRFKIWRIERAREEKI